ncbi:MULTISPECIES: peptidoglycan-binding protein [Rhodomicrobium]|uniref:lytic murein transglycosylase n=1 Tax=Rhodomicrobium TaxID=1068 RepID=UPI000B4AA7EB|nr:MULTISPECIES: peptidoglycan-binding protein [Rhodomicrobium]
MFRLCACRTLIAVMLAVCALAMASPVRAASFEVWLGELWPEAKAAGVSRATFDRVFAGMTPDCGVPGVFCPGEKEKPAGRTLSERTGLPETCNKITQSEFLQPEKYFPPKYMRSLALRGKGILDKLEKEGPKTHQALIDIEQNFRIPRAMLMGLWGRETAFGDAKLDHNALQALASSAYAGYKSRRDWSRKQLIAALKMVEDGHITPEKFRSSYAGATGLTQIMPDEFLGFAVDGDRDGKRDIWNSMPDAMATTANVLKDRGWHSAARSWGYEIKLPPTSQSFDCTMENRTNRWPIGEWASRYGISRLAPGGGTLDFPNPAVTGYLVMPAGARGPAFIATENFDVLRSYNPSDLYALFVGHLADRVGCDTDGRECGFQTPWPKATDADFEFSVENLCRMQVALKQRGFLDGTPDGLFGAGTRVAIGRYQKAMQRSPDCYPTRTIFQELTGKSGTQALNAPN